MSRHYYFAASLPLLQFDAPAPMELEEYLALCKEHLPAGEWRKIEQARLAVDGDGGSHPLLRRWYRWETELRNQLVRLRSVAHGEDPLTHQRPLPASAYQNADADVIECEVLARELYGQDNPLYAEQTLDRARWALLESMELGHAFDTEILLIYAIKLQILARRAQQTEEAGRERFERIRAAGVDQIKSREGLYE